MSGWGYEVDYAVAIREDEARIAHLSSPMCVGAAGLLPEARKAYPSFSSWSVYQLITYSSGGVAARAAMFDLTLEDVRAWAYFSNEDGAPLWSVLGNEQPGDYARGKTIDERFCAFEVYEENARRAALSKARASLARHKRNRERHMTGKDLP